MLRKGSTPASHPLPGGVTILASIATEDETQAEETEIAPARAAELVSAGVPIVDVRQDYEWEAGHISGATHIPLEQLPSRAEEFDRGQPIVFQCRSGSRSSFATAAFREAGFQAFNLEGGLQAWVEDGQPIEPADGVVADPLLDGR